MTFYGVHRLQRQRRKRELRKMCNRSSTLLLQLAIAPENHEHHKSHLPHKAISGPSHINIVWHQKTKEDAISFHNWLTDTWLFMWTLSGGSTLNAQPLTRQQVTNLMCVWGSKFPPQGDFISHSLIRVYIVVLIKPQLLPQTTESNICVRRNTWPFDTERYRH